jgi:hypothetical protein
MITANVAGTANYNAAAPASQTLNVGAATSVGTLLSEEFTTLISGTEASPSTIEVTSNLTSNFPISVKAYPAGGLVKLGTSSLSGSITSKSLDLSGNGGSYTVAFDVKGWTTVEGDILVTPSSGSAQTVKYTTTSSSTSYERKTITFTGGTAATTLIFATTAKRAYLDNITITQPGAGIPTIASPNGTFSALSTTYGAASVTSATTVTVTGGSLTSGIVATAPTGFEVSNDGANYGTTATFAQTSGFANGTLYLRLAATAAAGSRWRRVG